MNYKTIDEMIGNTPLVRLQRQDTGTSTVLAKLEGNNPAGSVKDRPAYGMIAEAEGRGDIQPGDTLIEATSGNTGIALAMVAAMRGYHMVLIMPESASEERKAVMAAYGAELILTPKDGGMEAAIDRARALETEGRGRILNQFGNPDNPAAHYGTTGPEIWRDTGGELTHFVASMGTTGTIMGTGRYLKERNPAIRIVGVQPSQGAKIPGSRAWPEDYLPSIYEPERVDRIMDITQPEAEEMARRLAREEGIFAGISSGASIHSAVTLAREVDNALIVAIVCDRGDRYLSTGVFPAP
ncbi:MAG: cysteine synthase CysM [Spirochaetes bacterium]|jgi:cysteine synthase B|nr:cysteine synthase CysM [Spirochaetota bacterium]